MTPSAQPERRRTVGHLESRAPEITVMFWTVGTLTTGMGAGAWEFLANRGVPLAGQWAYRARGGMWLRLRLRPPPSPRSSVCGAATSEPCQSTASSPADMRRRPTPPNLVAIRTAFHFSPSATLGRIPESITMSTE